MTTHDTWIVISIAGLIIAGTAQVLINLIVLKRFANHAKHLKLLDDEVFGDMTAYCKNGEEDEK